MTKQLTKWSNIQMVGKKTAELNISGYIGVPEWWQFDPDMEKELISTKEKMQAELKEISNIKATDIKVNVDSLGGDFNHAQAMATAISKTGANIEVEYVGWSASAATIFGTIATDNNVSMSPMNMILIHQARGGEYGVASTMRSYADMLDKVNSTMHNAYSAQTGKEKEAVIAQMNVNNGEGEWMTADEALKFGLINKVNEPLRAAATYDVNRLAKFGYNIPLNKLKTINMKFGKDKSINALTMQDDSILLHEGELKEGVELKTVGENTGVEAGEYEAKDGRKITVDEDSKITSIVEANESAASEDNEILNAIADMLVEFEAKVDEKIEALKKTGSKGKVPKTDLTSTEFDAGTQASARAGMQARLKEIADKKRKERGQ